MKNKHLFDAIDEILWQDWDPIGLNDSEDIRDEYRGYVPSLLKLKKQEADVVKISQHLYRIETIDMGMAGNMEHCQFIAQKIYEL